MASPPVQVCRWREPGPNGRVGRARSLFEAMREGVAAATGERHTDADQVDRIWRRLEAVGWRVEEGPP